MPKDRQLKSKVLKTAKQTAARAAATAKTAVDYSLDQVLLKFEHPAVKRMADKVATPETKDMIARLSQKVLEQAQAVRASLDPAVLKPVANAVTEEVKSQINAVKKDPKGSMVKATQAAVNAAKGAQKLGGRAAKNAGKKARKTLSGAVAKAKTVVPTKKSAKSSLKD